MRPSIESAPPRTSITATAMVERKSTSGTYTARTRVAFTPLSYISPVRRRKLSVLSRSMTSVLEVLAPVMPSLKAPVMRLFSLRTRRFHSSSRPWK